MERPGWVIRETPTLHQWVVYRRGESRRKLVFDSEAAVAAWIARQPVELNVPGLNRLVTRALRGDL